MPLLTCKLCGKIFTSSGGRTCPDCHTRLDGLYPKVREHLRDNPKTDFNVDTLANELETDVRDIQALVDMGYLDRDIDRRADPETLNRQKLAQEFESSLKQMQESAAQRAQNAASYGQQRYGELNKKK
ncbi:MAG: hypothetical protein LBC93_00955 [Synergistaceae bacterium]|jgi:hypothetical protein|nr:hypothetical protein [Synergistaceae bacterium]